MTAPLRHNGLLVERIERSCTSKRRYPDEFVARGAGQILGQKNDIKLYVYQCPLCRGWHLTKNSQRNKQMAADYQFESAPR